METIKGKESYSQCKIYQGLNSTSGITEGCPNGWEFMLNGKESTIVNEVLNVDDLILIHYPF